VLIFKNKSDSRETLLRQNRTGKRLKRREWSKRREKPSKLRSLNKREKREKVRKYDFYWYKRRMLLKLGNFLN